MMYKRYKKKTTQKREYRYYVVQREVMIDGQEPIKEPLRVIRGLSRDSVNRRLVNEDLENTRKADYGGNYAPAFYTRIITVCETKEEAERRCNLLNGLDEWENRHKRQSNNRRCHSDGVEAPNLCSDAEDEEFTLL